MLRQLNRETRKKNKIMTIKNRKQENIKTNKYLHKIEKKLRQINTLKKIKIR